METKRIDLPSILATRDPSTGKDGLLVNCYTEQGPDEKRIVRRPGFVSESLIPGSVCNAQGAYFFNGQPVYLVCDTLITEPTPEGPPPPVATPVTQAQGSYMITDPVTGWIWANIPSVGTAVYDGHTLLHIDTITPPINSVTGQLLSPGGNLCLEAGSRRIWTSHGSPGLLGSPDVWAIDADTHQIVKTLEISSVAAHWVGTIVNEGSGKLRIFGRSGSGGDGGSQVFNVNGLVTAAAQVAPGSVFDTLELPVVGNYVLSGYNAWLRVVKAGVWNDFVVAMSSSYCYNTTDGCLYIMENATHKLRKLDLTTMILTNITTFAFQTSSICYDAVLNLLWIGGGTIIRSVQPSDGTVVRTIDTGLNTFQLNQYWYRLRTIPDTTWLVSDLGTVIRGVDVTP